ncbi:hypothetical protein WJX72_002461 [[Myrmecia] bisecta]|uniref:Serine/threonine-protein kinase BSK1-like TPR repeats domain-containing protein n=1 Tax=[Myrmecia] bisecta TaxID=41462 RepID=A0AAW1R5Y5_9CHLO
MPQSGADTAAAVQLQDVGDTVVVQLKVDTDVSQADIQVEGTAQSGNVAQLQAAAQRFQGEDLGSVKDGNGRCVLHFAAQLGRQDMCRHLLDEAHVDVNAQDEAGETPLSLAAGAGQLPTVMMLLDHNADVSRCAPGGAAPIHRAATSGSTEVLEALLAAGADVEAPSTPGTPLLWAAGSGKSDCVKALLAAGADPHATGDANVGTVLMATATGSTDVVNALLAAGANPNHAANGGVTALHAAAESSQPDMIKLLLEAGANADVEDEGGHTPISAAAAAGCRQAVEMLLPRTSQPAGAHWTVDSLIQEAQQAEEAPAPSGQAEVSIPEPEEPNPDQAAQHKRRGDEAFVAKKFLQAADAYSQALRHDTRSHLIWANRAASNLRLGRNEEALEDARRARTLKPDYTKAWYREGCAAQALERWEDAAQAYFEGYRQEPTNQEIAAAFQNAVAEGQKRHQQQKAQAGAS